MVHLLELLSGHLRRLELGHDTHMPSQLVIVEMPQKLLLQMTSNLVIS